MSVGLALAERMLAARFNRAGPRDRRPLHVRIASDGDMQEGVSAEASSLAGHLGLGKLVVFYDDNKIQLDGPTSQSFSEDVAKRYEAYGWHVQNVGEDMSLERLEQATARRDGGRGPAVADSSAHAHRLRQPAQAGHLGGPRLAARRGRGPADQGGLRLGSRQALLRARRRRSSTSASAAPAGGSSRPSGRSRFAAYREAFPEPAELLRADRRRELPDGWEARASAI